MLTLDHFLLLSGVLFAIGTAGVLIAVIAATMAYAPL